MNRTRKANNTCGFIAVFFSSAVFALCALICAFRIFCIPPFGASIIAIIFGIIGMRYDEEALMGKVGLVIGIIEIAYYFIQVLINFLLYYMYGP